QRLPSTTCARRSTKVSKFATWYWSKSPAAKAARTPERTNAARMPGNVKILLVDDNPMVLGMLRQALSPLANVSTAGDTADALLKAVDESPDLLVSDYRMPGIDGRQLLEKLKSRPATASVAVILMASKGDISERLSAQEHVEDYI